MDYNKEVLKFKSYLQNSQKILLINHRRMDGDAYWSLASFYYILKKIWIYEIKCINDDETPKIFDFIKKEELFTPTLNLKDFNPDIIISFDVWSKEQLWEIYKNNLKFFLSTTFINIDHHKSNELFWNINIVNTSSSSACELLYDVILDLWFKKYIDNYIASLLLMWIITDTNSFFNNNSTTKTFQIAWDLMFYKPIHQEIILNLFKKKSYNKMKLWWKILENLKDIKNSQIVWNIIPKSYFISTNTTDKDISWIIDEFLMTINWLKVWFLLYELSDKKIKWTFRSKTDDIDLNELCKKYWWWWHKRAAWFILEWKNIYELEQSILSDLTKII